MKAHTTCDTETGEVEIGWPDNTSLYEGVLGKDIFASGATKNVYKVFIPPFPFATSIVILIEI